MTTACPCDVQSLQTLFPSVCTFCSPKNRFDCEEFEFKNESNYYHCKDLPAKTDRLDLKHCHSRRMRPTDQMKLFHRKSKKNYRIEVFQMYHPLMNQKICLDRLHPGTLLEKCKGRHGHYKDKTAHGLPIAQEVN